MAAAGMQYVAIVGGLWKLSSADLPKAQQMAQEIGTALAGEGMGLVVYNSDPRSLEPHVVTGYVKAIPAGSGANSIRVRYAESQVGAVQFAEEATRRELFEPDVIAGQEWEAPFYRSLVQADRVDAVLLMGGDRSTLIAGQIALARPLPVLAVDKFVGSAKIIRSELALLTNEYPSSATHDAAKMVKWLKSRCAERAKEQAKARKREKDYLDGAAQRATTTWALSAFIPLLFLICYGLAGSPSPATYTVLMFAGLVVAGATGASVRSVFWGSGGKAPRTSLLLGGFAGFVVGIAYLVPQFIGAPGVLAQREKVEATDKIQLVSAILVAISAGVGFDTVFNRLRKQAEELPISAG